MFKKELVFKSIYNWRTLLLGFSIFIIIYFGVIILLTPIGGCAGCVPNGNGGATCVNKCKPINPIILISASYIIALITVIVYKSKKSNRLRI